MLCTNYTLFSPVFLGIFTLFSADTKYGYHVGMRANLLHYLHLLDQVVHFLLRAVLLNKRTFTRLSFHTWDQTCKGCLTMLYNTMPHLKIVGLQNLHWLLMTSLVSKDTSTHHWRPLRQAFSFPKETNTAYMSAWEFIAQLRCSFALSRLVITRTVQFRIQNMALLCWLLAPLHHLNIKQ